MIVRVKLETAYRLCGLRVALGVINTRCEAEEWLIGTEVFTGVGFEVLTENVLAVAMNLNRHRLAVS